MAERVQPRRMADQPATGEQWEHGLGLGITKPAVKLEHPGTVGRDHEVEQRHLTNGIEFKQLRLGDRLSGGGS